MESRAKLFGHAIHPMLIPFPLGLLSTAAIFDVIFLITKNPAWATASYFLIAAGLIGGLAAAVFGAIDFMAIPVGTRARRIGMAHGIGNLVLIGFFALSLFTRMANQEDPPLLAIGLALIGAGLGLITGWLGGELVSRLGVSVAEGANLDASSSLTGDSARAPAAAGD